jgi:hypothetical protein
VPDDRMAGDVEERLQRGNRSAQALPSSTKPNCP